VGAATLVDPGRTPASLVLGLGGTASEVHLARRRPDQPLWDLLATRPGRREYSGLNIAEALAALNEAEEEGGTIALEQFKAELGL
jgi:hypothetical protein